MLVAIPSVNTNEIMKLRLIHKGLEKGTFGMTACLRREGFLIFLFDVLEDCNNEYI
jgi:hypothetical protein